jgi:enediyne biosynthesis protein E4
MKPGLAKFWVLSLFIFYSCTKNSDLEQENTLFVSLPAQKTGVDFINLLTETEAFNIIDYLYFYNGGGVSVGDINNDGLIDIYFSSNQGRNKLFLNKGKMVFEDISKKSGLESLGSWKTGVSMVDINGDGLLDIYVCRLGNFKGISGKNELYINNGDLTFSEKAAEYGLDFQGFSTHASFFDYDRDGDLDMYLLNHAVHTEKSFGRASLRYLDDGLAGDRLFKNNSDKGEKRFTDITNEAKIYSSQLGYGLGTGISDLNNDGWPDLYVSNDFNENDYLYLNKSDGTFQDQTSSAINYSSRFSMGSDFADMNNDGWVDFITLDMLAKEETIQKLSAGEETEEILQQKLNYGFERQFSRNCFQLNNGNGTFSEIAQLSGISATDWSWGVLLADYDNDGWKDIFISNGIVRRPNDLDYMNFITNPNLENGLQNNADLSDLELASEMPPGDVANFFFRNNKDLTFQDVSATWNVSRKNISNGSAYADLDNDGDLDLIINNINSTAEILENQQAQQLGKAKNNFLKIRFKGLGANKFGLGSRVEAFGNGKQIIQENFTSRGFQSSTAPEVHLGLGEINSLDSLTIIWPSGKIQKFTNVKANQILTVDESAAKTFSSYLAPTKAPFLKVVENELSGLNFDHYEDNFNDFNYESLLPHKLSQEGPALAVGDVNGDGREDVYVGGASGQAGHLFIQSQGGKFQKSNQPIFEKDAALEDTEAIFFDSNKDGFLDLVVGRGGNVADPNDTGGQSKIYLNNGKGEFQQSISLPLEKNAQVSVILAHDFDQDGLADLMVGGRNVAGKYGQIPRSYLLKNLGENRYQDITNQIAPELANLGMVKDAAWTDIDADGTQDLIVIGEWMPITIFLTKKGKLVNETVRFGLDNTNGWWSSIAVEDFNQDGFPDVVVGNLGLNNRLKPSAEFPIKMVVADFDKNGTSEQIISYPVDGNYFTVATKDELVKQIPILKKDFVRYNDFAGKTVDEVFAKFQIKDSPYLKSHQFESLVLYNQKGKDFIAKALPIEAQFSPIEDIAVEDIDQDGYLDLVLGGNTTAVASYFGSYQGNWGLILKGDATGSFKTFKESSLKIKGDVKQIREVTVGTNKWLIFAKNNSSLEVFSISKNR